MYAIIKSGEVVGETVWPNSTSQTPVDKLSAQWLAHSLRGNRKAKIAEIKAEAIRRISADVPALNSMAMIDRMVEIWAGLNTAAMGADILAAAATYTYAKTKITQAESATQAQLDAYDPTTDQGWS